MDIIPAFDWQSNVVDPWTTGFSSTIWVAAMGVLVAVSCGMVGAFLVVRRMALIGDAISHSMLPGLVTAFLISGSRDSVTMMVGALIAGVGAAQMVEGIHRFSRIKQDAAIGITFSTFFAIGVVLVTQFADKVDLDTDCVLYGELMFVALEPSMQWFGMDLGPGPVVRMAVVAMVVLGLMFLFWKELVVSSFDPGLAEASGMRVRWIHYGLMASVAAVVVCAFEAVGAILVIAMLILPSATARLLADRLPTMMAWVWVHGVASTLMGLHLAFWLNCSVGAAMAVSGGALFAAAWMFRLSREMLGTGSGAKRLAQPAV